MSSCLSIIPRSICSDGGESCVAYTDLEGASDECLCLVLVTSNYSGAGFVCEAEKVDGENLVKITDLETVHGFYW